MMKNFKPKDATIAITYKCNSRCQMCNIWQIKDAPELPLQAFKNLSTHLRYINLSGGEPFLRSDLVEIVRIISKTAPKAQIILSTNGLASELIAERMKEIIKIHPDTGIRISIDGLESTHNRIRGIANMYDRAMRTIELLKEIGIDNLGISFTVMDQNIDELTDVYNWAAKEDLQFAMALVQNSDIYFGKKDNEVKYLDKVEAGLKHIVRHELSSLNPKRWARAFYDYGLLEYARKQKRLLKSGAGFDSLFIDPKGEVFPSNLINLPMGNILDNKLDQIWNEKKAKAVRAKIQKENIEENWIVCTIRGEMKKNIHKVLWWIVTRKLGMVKL